MARYFLRLGALAVIAAGLSVFQALWVPAPGCLLVAMVLGTVVGLMGMTWCLEALPGWHDLDG